MGLRTKRLFTVVCFRWPQQPLFQIGDFVPNVSSKRPWLLLTFVGISPLLFTCFTLYIFVLILLDNKRVIIPQLILAFVGSMMV